MSLTPLTVPGRAQQLAFARQTAVATPRTDWSTSSHFLKWRQGSMVAPKMDIAHEFEGDGNRGEALIYKKLQYSVGKLIFAPRPYEACMAFAAFAGAGSDTGGSPHVISAGASCTNDYYTLLQQINCPPAASATTGYDACCYGLNVASSTQNPVLVLDTDWYGRNSTISSDLPVPTGIGSTADPNGFEQAGPFYFYSAKGGWTLPYDNAGSQVSAAVREFNFKMAYELTPADFQAEDITPLPFVPGNLTISGDMTCLWQDGGLAAYTYMNGVANGATLSGTVDDTGVGAGAVASGAFSVKFLCSSDVVSGSLSPQYLQLDVPNMSFESAEFTPDLSGKPIEQKLMCRAVRYAAGTGVASDLFSVTILAADATGASS
jgi:hypothetical protein